MSYKTKQGFNSSEYETPKWLFDHLHSQLTHEGQAGFSCDMACTKKNEKVKGSFGIHQGDALNFPWSSIRGLLWVNPPCGKGQLIKWLKKACVERDKGAKIMMFVPLTTIANLYFPKYKSNTINIISGRINLEYKGKEIKGNAHNSCLLQYDKDLVTGFQILKGLNSKSVKNFNDMVKRSNSA